MRGFTRDNPARAALAVRDMIKADAQVSDRTCPARSYTGVERAAVLMMLVGEEEAAAILQKLEPEEVRQLGKAMFKVADVSEQRGRGRARRFRRPRARAHRRSASTRARRSRR